MDRPLRILHLTLGADAGGLSQYIIKLGTAMIERGLAIHSVALFVQRAIAAKLDPDYLQNPSVSAEVITRRPFYVIGEVQKPGNYPYVTDMTALQAVAMAGGYTYRARQNNLYLKRLDANGRMIRVAATPETKVKPGDTVEVKERYF